MARESRGWRANVDTCKHTLLDASGSRRMDAGGPTSSAGGHRRPWLPRDERGAIHVARVQRCARFVRLPRGGSAVGGRPGAPAPQDILPISRARWLMWD